MSPTRIINAARMEWLEERRKGLGGSDMAAVAGLSPYGSPWSVYWDKVNVVLDDGQSEAALWGTLNEGTIADEWARRAGRTVIKPQTLVIPGEEWMRGNPDGLVAGPAGAEVLEVKTAGEWAWATQWDGGHVVPAWYEAQCQWYMRLAGARRAHLAVLVGGNRLETLHVERNDRAIELLVDLGRRFWHDHVLAGVAPPPDASRAARAKLDDLYPARAERVVVTPHYDDADDLLEVIDKYRHHRGEAKRHETLRDEAGNRLVQYLGERQATDLVIGDDPVVTYRPTRRLDVDALVASLEEEELAAITGAGALRATYDTKTLERVLGRKRVEQYRKVDPDRRTLRVVDPDDE
jgi:putative phage-type endonuclease